MRPVVLLGLTLLALAPRWASPSLAQDAAPAPDPAPAPAEATVLERTRAVRATLPAPSEKVGFTFESEVLFGGNPFGTATYAAKPMGSAENLLWEVTETAAIAASEQRKAQDHRTNAVLRRDLGLVAYDRTVKSGDVVDETTQVIKTATGAFHVVRGGGAGKPFERDVEADATMTATLASLLLFLRACPAEPATYEMPVFSSDAGSVVTGRLDVKGATALKLDGNSIPAFFAVATLGERVFDVYLSAGDRQPLAVGQPKRGVLFLGKGLRKPVQPHPIDTTKPPASAKEVGERFALGMMIGDWAIIDASIDWAAWLADARKVRDFKGTEAEFKAELKSNLERGYMGLERTVAESRVGRAVSTATERADGDVVEVRFGPPLEDYMYRAKARDKGWVIVEMLKAR